MKGGYQIIDIRKLNLTLSNTTHSITDAEILEQLRSLRAYIQKGHDFTKPLDNALKCIQIRYRDQKNGEKLEACQWANIETSNDSLTYEIKTKSLMIEIVFEEKTDEYDNKYYDIKTAKYLYNHNEIIEGNLDIAHDLTIGGNAKIFENIVDKDGHKRFVEFDGTPNTITGVNVVYCKASLSGTHLMFVIAGSIANETQTGAVNLVTFELPEWIRNKIYPLFAGGNLIEYKNVNAVSTGYGQKQIKLYEDKTSTGIGIYLQESFVADADYSFRIQFDLLIDNETN